MASFTRCCAVLWLGCSALLLALPAHAECGGGQQCIAVAFGDAQPAHGTPIVSTPLAFGTVQAGTTSGAQRVRVGAVAGPAGTRATLDAITIVGANAAEFTIESTTCVTGTPSLLHDGRVRAQLANTCTIDLVFRPVAAGSKSASLRVRTARITRVVPLTGSATPSATGPIAAATSLATQVNTPATIDLAPFITGTASGIAIAAQPAHGSVAVDGTRVTYTPVRDYFGPDGFAYSAFNAAGSSAPAQVSVSVGGRPDPSQDAEVVGLLSAQAQAARRFAQAQIANIQQRLEGLRSAAPAPVVRAAVPVQPAESAGSGALGAGGAPQASGLWVGGNLDLGRSGESASLRRRFRTEGASVGFDHRVRDGLLLGAALGYADDRTDVGANGTATRSHGASIALYGSWQPAPDQFVDALLGYGQLTHDSDRFVPSIGAMAQARGRDSHQLFGSIAGGWLLRRGGVLLSPYGRLDLGADRFDEATETGAGLNALTYFAHTQKTVRLAAGLRAESRHATSFGLAIPRLRVELRHALHDGDAMRLSFADQVGGPVYSVSPLRSDRTAVLLGVGTDLVMRNGVALGIDYLLQRSTDADRSHAVRLFLRKDFDAPPIPGTADAWQPAGVPLRVEAGYFWDDNLTRAANGPDRLSDHVFTLGVHGSRAFPLGEHVRGVLGGFVTGDKPYRHEGLERIGGGLRGELQYRASGAFDAPTFALFGRAQHDEFHSPIRSGQRYTLGVSAQQSWTDRLDAFAALAWNRRDARSEVFDGSDWGARFQLDVAMGRGTLFFGPEYRRGDIVSTSSSSGAGYDEMAKAHVADDAFGRPGLEAFRFDARTWIWTLGWNIPLGARDSLDLSWRHVDSRAIVPAALATLYGGAPRYRANIWSLYYLVRF